VRQIGQEGLWSRLRTRQMRQKVWPQMVVVGSVTKEKQSLHSSSSAEAEKPPAVSCAQLCVSCVHQVWEVRGG
jgi:hypothetical protein